MSPNLEQYILSHSSPEDPILEDLYRQTHLRFVNPNMVSGHIQGKFLELMTLMINPSAVLEIGTFTGYSAICMAKGLKQGGKLITIEINDELKEFARSYFIKSGVDSKIIQLTGNALDIIPGLDIKFDLVLIDGDKREYIEYFNKIFEKVNPGGFIIADNTLWGGKVLDNKASDPQSRGIIEFNEMLYNNKDLNKLILPLRDGLTIIQKPV